MRNYFKWICTALCLVLISMSILTSCSINPPSQDGNQGDGNQDLGFGDVNDGGDDNNGNQEEQDKVYTVNFYDDEGNLLKSERVLEGKSAKAPNGMTKEGLCFVGWDTEFDKVYSDLDVYAVYDTVENVYGSVGNVFDIEAVESTNGKITVTFSHKQDAVSSAVVIGFQVRLHYDEGFVAESVVNGKGVSSSIHDKQNYISVVYINLNATAIENGFEFITVTFTLTDEIEIGDRIYIETQYVLDENGNDITSAISISSEFVYN